MTQRQIIILAAGIALLGLLLLVARCVPQDTAKIANQTRQAAQERAIARRLQAACASPTTYDRLKLAAFEEAIRIRNADPVNLATLATYSTVRMEQPQVKGRDETLDVTVCTGRFVLDIPPGAERAFGGARRLEADIEYSAQAAADGSGLVYKMKGAEPIIYKLAAFDLQAQAYRPDATTSLPDLAVREVVEAQIEDFEDEAEVAGPDATPEPQRQARPVVRASDLPRAVAPREELVRPSFNCRQARTRTERMVCASPRLAALDREMAAVFADARDRGSGRERAELLASRDRFLAYRERCPNDACVAQAYQDRMDEIDDIVG